MQCVDAILSSYQTFALDCIKVCSGPVAPVELNKADG